MHVRAPTNRIQAVGTNVFTIPKKSPVALCVGAELQGLPREKQRDLTTASRV